MISFSQLKRLYLILVSIDSDFTLCILFDILFILIGIDGIPIFKKSRLALWPIMGAFVKAGVQVEPFIIGAFLGLNKPEKKCEFLLPFVKETNQLIENGIKIAHDKKRFKIRAICVDAPARSMICGTRYHTAMNGCHFCNKRGSFVGKYLNIYYLKSAKTLNFSPKLSFNHKLI